MAKVYQRRLLIGLLVFIMTGLAYKLTSGLTPIYQSQAQLVLVTQNASASGSEQASSMDSLDVRTIQTKLQEIQSANFLAKIAEDHGLLGLEEFNPAPKPLASWERALTDIGILSPPQSVDELTLQQAQKAQVIQRLQERISASVVGMSHVIEVAVRSEDPELAASLANTTANAYLNINLDSHYEAAEQTAGWFAEKVATLKGDIDTVEHAIASYRAQNEFVGTGREDRTARQIEELKGRLALVEAERAADEAKLRLLQNLRSAPEQLETAIGIAGNPLIQNIQDRILAKRSEVKQLSAELGSNHPKLILAREELEGLERALFAELDRLIPDTQESLSKARSQEVKLGDALVEHQSKAANSDRARVTLATMEQDADAKRSLLEAFLSHRTEMTAQEDFLNEQPGAKIIADAVPAMTPSYPPTKTIVIGVLMGSLVLGCLVAICSAELDNTFRHVGQLERKYPSFPVIGTVPIFGRMDRSHKRVALAVVKSPDTAYAESIRMLADKLARLIQADPEENSFVFTSAEPGEGKTSTIAGVARQLALIDKKVVLIDGDLRHPTLHKTFSMLTPRGGLIPYLNNELPLDQLSVTDSATPLDVIFSGGQIRDPNPLIDSDRMTELMTGLRHRYDIVLIDAPPVAAVDDVQYLCKYAGMTILCVRWGETRQRIVDRALTTLVDSDSRQPIGLVLSLMDAAQYSSYGYGGNARMNIASNR